MKLLKTTLLLAVAGIITFGMFGCKKGPNDPFLSFRSRTARLEGTWKLSAVALSMNSTTTKYDGSGNKTNVNKTDVVGKYDGSSNTRTTTYTTVLPTGVNPLISISSHKYSLTLSLRDSGNSHITESIQQTAPLASPAAEIYYADGTWNWLNDNKKKSGFTESALMNSEFATTICALFGSFGGGGLGTYSISNFHIDRLANKEMVLKMKLMGANSSTPNNSSLQIDYSYDISITFKQD